MAQAIAQAERERELTKQALAGTLDRLEARVRHELDWKARLRRDGVRYAVVGVIIVGAGIGLVVLRRVVKGEKPAAGAALAPSTFEDMATELAAIRKKLDSAKLEPGRGPLWQKIALQAVSAGATAGGTLAAKRFMERSGGDTGATAGTG